MKSKLVETINGPLYPYLGITDNENVVVMFTGFNEGVYVWTSSEYEGDVRVGDFRQDVTETRFVRLPHNHVIQLRN